MVGQITYVIVLAADRIALALILSLSLAALWLASVSSQRDGELRLRLLWACLAITAVGAAVELLMRSAALADVSPTVAWSFIPRVLTHSDYGFFWLVRLALWALMLVMAAWISRHGWLKLAAVVLLLSVLVTMLTLSVTGHAGEDGLWAVPNLVNWLHIIGTSLWGGTVILFALIVLPVLWRGTAMTQQLAEVSTRLSTLATVALIVVLVTGTYNSWHQLGKPADLWQTTYGVILLGKLALVAIMMSVGAMNRFVLVPRLQAWRDGPDHGSDAVAALFLKVLRVDSLVFTAVIVFALVLAMQSPPSHGM